MIVQRITVRYKVGKAQEATSLMKETLKRSQEQAFFTGGVRFYIPRHVSDTNIGEYEFESTSAMEQFWAAWQSTSIAQEFGQKYDLLVEPGGMTFEIFDLI